MNQLSQGEGSSGLSIQPLKRKRGRPRKDPSLKKPQAAPAPPGFEGVKQNQNLPQRVSRADGIDTMVGQPVSGVVEATFDAGYLLRVRIGNSTMNLRGVVFKPGHYAPVTAENDVVPHLQMIRRNDVHFPPANQGWSRTQKPAVQPGALVPSKRKYSGPPAAPAVPPVGVRGTLVPVVLQPVNLQNGSQNPNHKPSSDTSRTGHMMAFGDKDVHMVEPLSMLPPDRSIPVSQIFVGSQPQPCNQVSQGTKKNESQPFVQGEKANQMESDEHDNPGSSETSETQTDSGKEASKSSAEDSGIVSKQDTRNVNEPFSTESVQSASVTKPFFSYGTGRMTELLQAVQENMKEKKVQIAEHQSSGLGVEARETRTTETVGKSEAK